MIIYLNDQRLRFNITCNVFNLKHKIRRLDLLGYYSVLHMLKTRCNCFPSVTRNHNKSVHEADENREFFLYLFIKP